jgi:hypothetical protein
MNASDPNAGDWWGAVILEPLRCIPGRLVNNLIFGDYAMDAKSITRAVRPTELRASDKASTTPPNFEAETTEVALGGRMHKVSAPKDLLEVIARGQQPVRRPCSLDCSRGQASTRIDL